LLNFAVVPEDPNNLAAVAKPYHVAGDSRVIVESLAPADGELWYDSLTRLSSASVIGGAEFGALREVTEGTPTALPAILPQYATAKLTA
jgi:hypothetical protein